MSQVPLFVLSRLLSSLWVSRTGSASDWCALQEALYKCKIQYNTIQYNTSPSLMKFCKVKGVGVRAVSKTVACRGGCQWVHTHTRTRSLYKNLNISLRFSCCSASKFIR